MDPATPLEECADNFDGNAFFDLTVAGAEILNGQAGLTITYHETEPGAQIGGVTIPTPANYYSTAHTVYARVIQTGSTTNCATVVPIVLIVHPRPNNPVMTNYVQCDVNASPDGIELFDLTTKDAQASGGDASLTVSYYTTLADAQGGTAAIADPANHPISAPSAGEVPNDQQIWVRVTSGFGCASVGSFHIIVNPLPVINPDLGPFFACEEVPGQGEFHFDEMDTVITNGADGYTVTYYETLAQALLGGTDYESSPYLSPSATIVARVSDVATGCWTTTPVELEVIPAPIATEPEALEECDFNNDGFAAFNLDPVIQAIEAELGDVTVTVHETEEDATFNVNVITNTAAYVNVNQHTQTLHLRVQSDLTECYDLVTLQLIVNPVPEAVTPTAYELCDDGASDTDGIATFDLTTKAGEILGALDPALYSISYHDTEDAAKAGTAEIPNPASYNSASRIVWVRVSNNATDCYDVVELELIVNPLPSAIQPTPLSLCDVTAPANDQKEIFDLTVKIPEIIGAQEGINVTFHHSFANAQAGTNAITNPAAYQNGPVVETLFVRVTIEETGCFRVVLLDIRVEPLPVILPPGEDALTVCDTNGEGIGEFDLDALVEAMKNGEPNLEITFHFTAEDAASGENAIPNTDAFHNTNPYTQTIYVRVENTLTGCVNSVPYALELIVSPAPQAPDLEDLTKCDDTDNNNADNKAVFDLTVQDAAILEAMGLEEGDVEIHYFISEAFARAGAPRITNAATYQGTGEQVIWVRVEDPVSECFSLTSFTLHINKPLPLTTPPVLAICDNLDPMNDARGTFNLRDRDDDILGPLGIGQGYTVEYYETNPRVVTVPPAAPIANPEAYANTANPKTLYVVVTSGEGCKSYTTLTIKVLPRPVPDMDPAPLVLCDDNNSPDAVEVFDLTLAEDDIRNNDDTVVITYHSDPDDAEEGINAIATPTAYSSASGFVWVRVEANTNNPLDPKCHVVVQLELIVNPLPAIGDPVKPYAICQENTTGFAEFDLNSHIEKILGANAEDYDIEFYLDQAALDAGTALARMYTNVTPAHQVILVVVTNGETGCSITKPLDLIVEEAADANAPLVDTITECDDDGTNDGFHLFDLTIKQAEILGGQNPADFTVTYHLSGAEAQQGDNPIANPSAFTNTAADAQTIWVRVIRTISSGECDGVVEIHLVVERLAEPVVTGQDGSNTVCIDVNGNTAGLMLYSGITGPGYTFMWKHDGVDVTLDPAQGTFLATEGGNYTVTVTSANNCKSDESAAFEVIESGVASPVGRGYYVTNYFSDNQTITVTVEGNGEYKYRLDDGPWQDSPVFTNVSPGYHTVTVKDFKTDFTCGELVLNGVSVVDYPNFFTPNGDGFHDTWNIIGLKDTGSVIYIFDRYGKLMKQISADSEGWDGTFNGSPVPSTDYWFTVTYPEEIPDGNGGTTTVTREFKAHFSLKR